MKRKSNIGALLLAFLLMISSVPTKAETLQTVNTTTSAEPSAIPSAAPSTAEPSTSPSATPSTAEPSAIPSATPTATVPPTMGSGGTATNELRKVMFNGSDFATNSINLDVPSSEAMNEIKLVPLTGYVCPEMINVNGKVLRSVAEAVYGIEYDQVAGTISGIPSENLITIEAKALVDNSCAIAECTDTSAKVLVDIGPSNQTIEGITIKTGNNDYGALISFIGNVVNGKALFWLTDLSPNTNYIVQPKYNDNKLGKTFTFTTRSVQPEGIRSVWNGSIIDVKGINGLQTTYGNGGWGFNNALDGNVQSFITTYNLSQNVNEVTVVLRNNGSSAVSGQRFAFHADVQIGYNDRAPISNVLNQGFLMTDGVNKLYIINEGNGIKNGHNPLGGITAATTTKWWGYYSDRGYYLYANRDGFSDLTGTDSGAAFSWQNISLEPGETRVYTFKIAAGSYDSGDLTDVEAPTDPTGLKTESKDTESIKISWTPSTDNVAVAGYRVYRDGILIKTCTETSYEDTGLTPATSYTYTVEAFDEIGNTSNSSQSLVETTLIDNEAPSIISMVPTNAIRIGTLNQLFFGPNAYITVKAQDNMALTSIKLQYSTNGTTWNDIATQYTTVGPNIVETAYFNWSTAPLNANVSVRAVAYDKSGNASNGTPVGTYVVDNQGPDKVTGLEVTAHSTYVVLKWNDVADQDFSYFMVEKKKDDGTFENAGTTSTTLGMNMLNLMPDKSYVYRVVAYDRFGNRGTVSDEITAVTLSDTTAPWITGMGPSSSSFTDKISLWASARDNANVSSVKFQVSTNLISWTDIATITNSYYNTDFTAMYEYNVSGLAAGKIYIRPVAIDPAGLTSKTTESFTYAEYVIDHTAPAAPSGIYAEPEPGLITLKWQQNAETDLKSYKVYRAENADGPFTLLAQDVESLGYRDRSIDQTTTYYYQVSAVDIAGNEGSKSATISDKAAPDTQAPKVLGIWPDSGKTLSANPQISVVAYDNYKLANLKVEIKKASDTEGTWTTVLDKAISTYNENVTFTLDTSAFLETTYTLRATATDTVGNVSEIQSASYDFNLVPPTKPVVTARAGGWKVDLTWARATEPDLAGYRIFRSTTSGGNYQLIKEINSDSYTDTNVTPDITYYYVVDSIDTFRNSNRSAEVNCIPTTEDFIVPVAVAGSEQITTANLPVYFDGTLSNDNHCIEEYLWDFGDGSSSTQSQPSHTYTTEGGYTVKLTVKDSAGNANSATTTVTVKSAVSYGIVEVKVVDSATGSPLGAASVVVEYADGTRYNTTTNGAGFVNVTVPAGDCKVYAYKTDYKPNYIAAKSVIGTKSTVTVGLESGQLVVGELTVNRMTLDQIKDAGIDVTAPENNWVYKFEVHLAFQNRPLPVQTIMVNGNGGLVGGDGGFYIPGPTGGYYAYPKAIPVPNHPEIRPTIAYLVIPGEARFLKEFFEVQLALENTADPVFVIEQSKAVLTLPDGLALATTREGQSLEVDIGDFKGGEKKEVKWIIRGDKKGMYTLQADFTGILQPFGEEVSATFTNSEAFRVWGDDALKLHIYAQNKVDKGYPYDVRFELENVSDIPVYFPAIELLESNKENYFYAPNQELVKSVETLKAGEKLVKTYTLVPSITGNLVLNASYVLKTGGNATIESFIHPISVPENMLNVAPKLTETQNGNVVTLSWGAVAGATGYKIYSVRKDMNMAKDPGELIATLPAGTLTYNITETSGTKDYIVTTLSASGEKMRHAINWPDVGDPAPAVITVNPNTIEVNKNTELWITVNNNGFPVSGGTVDVGSYYTGVELDINGQAKVFVNPTQVTDFMVTAYDAEHNKLVNTVVKVVNAIKPAIAYLESPKANQSVTGIVNVKGWFIDQNGVSKVEVMVDGNIVGEAVYGDARADVLAAYPEYNNANAGFHYALDTSKLSEGIHTLSVYETSKTNVQTLLKTVSVNIELKPIGRIDFPKASRTCNGKVEVKGWFLDQSGVTNVEVFVDGVFSGTAVYGGSRPDVKTVYPNYNNSANSGFQYVLDITTLSTGTHSVKVCGTGNSGTITTIGTVSITVLPTIGRIDSPKANATVSGTVTLRGWILDPNGVSKVEVLIDNALVGTATYGDSRPDVELVYPLYKNANSGFHYTLDTSKLTPGIHTLSVYETSKTNDQTLLKTVSINVELKPIGRIDSPKASRTCNGKVEVKGWFLDQSGVTNVEVFVDGVFSGTAVYGGSRSDVKTVYPNYNNSANSGFQYVLDTTTLSKGTHSVKVCGTGNSGTITTIGTVSITVLPTIGRIDSPKANATVSGTVTLRGWILDPNGVSKVEVLVDNVLVGTATYGDSRPDVELVYPLYNNENSGFHYTLDTSKLSEGKHTITVREISNKADSAMLIKNVDITVSKLP
ncbi:Ig-like domain-containing protein [Acetivibrio cellulolyticus]|uniref:Ig-like domain-containing protein n=1 Tax=Acetivibrio cellulolyticus TaxID=35830 RepID=UPI0001E2CBDA|nr:Ig-like domain-containing protein [Acetivibrio cellulolyticus]